MSSPFRRAALGTLKVGSAALVCGAMGLSAIQFCGRKCHLDTTFTEKSDPIFQHSWLRRINPRGNPVFHDIWARTVSFDDIKPELLDDAVNGGSRLLESYAAGMMGSNVFGVQRGIFRLARKSAANEADLWRKDECLRSKYPEGTVIADDFIVLEKTPSTLMLRGGLSPRTSPEGPRELDTVIELDVKPDIQNKTVSFKLKSVVLNGTETGRKVPIDGVACFLHCLYAKLLIAVGVDYCSR